MLNPRMVGLAALVMVSGLAIWAMGAATDTGGAATRPAVPPVLSFTMQSLAGKDVNLADYRGKVLLIINVASKCGNTPQYAPLEAMHEKYSPQGLAILGFPCNQFGGQEPGTAIEISTFCTQNYGVKFDMFAKIEVNGDGATPLYKLLTAAPPKPGPITWNFEKFLISRDGQIVNRWTPKTQPDSPEVVKAIEAELAKKS